MSEKNAYAYDSKIINVGTPGVFHKLHYKRETREVFLDQTFCGIVAPDLRSTAHRLADSLPNRAKNFTEDLVTAKAMVHDLEHLLKRMDETIDAIRKDTGLNMTYTLGPVGDSAASTRRDLAKQKPTAFALPKPT